MVGNISDILDMWDEKKKGGGGGLSNTINYVVRQFVYVHKVVVILLFLGKL